MRAKTIIAAAAAVMALGLSAPSEAFDDFRYRVGSPADPYSYVPRLPRYYPYRNSGYWVPTETMRYAYHYRFGIPPYYPSWGFNTREWSLAHRYDRRRWLD